MVVPDDFGGGTMVVPDDFGGGNVVVPDIGGGNMVVTYDILTTQWSSLGHESSLSLSESGYSTALPNCVKTSQLGNH